MRGAEERLKQLATFRNRRELVRLAYEWHVPFLPRVRDGLGLAQRDRNTVLIIGRGKGWAFSPSGTPFKRQRPKTRTLLVLSAVYEKLGR